MGSNIQKAIISLEELNEFTKSETFEAILGKKLVFYLVQNKRLPKLLTRFPDLKVKCYELDSYLQINSTSAKCFYLKEILELSELVRHFKTLSSLPRAKPLLDEVQCSICLNQNSDTYLGCGHGFCLEDLSDWHKKEPSCPICRSVSEEAYVDTFTSPEELQVELHQCKLAIKSLLIK